MVGCVRGKAEVEAWLRLFGCRRTETFRTRSLSPEPPWRSTVCVRGHDHLDAPDGRRVYDNRFGLGPTHPDVADDCASTRSTRRTRQARGARPVSARTATRTGGVMQSWLAGIVLGYAMRRLRAGDPRLILLLDAPEVTLTFPGDSTWAGVYRGKPRSNAGCGGSGPPVCRSIPIRSSPRGSRGRRPPDPRPNPSARRAADDRLRDPVRDLGAAGVGGCVNTRSTRTRKRRPAARRMAGRAPARSGRR